MQWGSPERTEDRVVKRFDDQEHPQDGLRATGQGLYCSVREMGVLYLEQSEPSRPASSPAAILTIATGVTANRTFVRMRRITKLLLSLVYYACRRLCLSGCGLVPGCRLTERVVLTYHQVRACDAARFERQLDLICRAGLAVWADATHIATGHRVIAITFDDGFDEALRVATPILEKRRIRSIWFVTTGYLGQAAGWIEKENHPNYGARLASMEQLKATDRRLVRIGAHTATHPRLPLIVRHQVDRELADLLETFRRRWDCPSTCCHSPTANIARTRCRCAVSMVTTGSSEMCRYGGVRRPTACFRGGYQSTRLTAARAVAEAARRVQLVDGQCVSAAPPCAWNPRAACPDI